MASAIGWIALNELRRVLTDRGMVFFGLLLPVTIIVLIGSAFGSVGSVELGLLDHDRSPASQRLVDQLVAIDEVEVDRYDSLDSMRRDVRLGAIHAGVHLPDGYGTSLDEGAADVRLVADIGSASTGPALTAVQAAVSQAGVRAAAVALLAGRLGAGEARTAVDEAAEELAPVGTREVAVDAAESEDAGSFAYTAPANLVLFVFINTFAVSTVLANDRKQGLVRRMLATPHRVGTILAGVGLAKLAFALIQSALIVGIGGLLFDVGWGDPTGAVLLVCLFAVLATAAGLLVGAIVSDADQAQSLGIPIAVAMGMLGGCMWPLEAVPDVMRVLGHLVPHAWAMDAWMQLVLDDGGVGDILLELGVLAAFAVVLGLLATRRLRIAVAG